MQAVKFLKSFIVNGKMTKTTITREIVKVQLAETVALRNGELHEGFHPRMGFRFWKEQGNFR